VGIQGAALAIHIHQDQAGVDFIGYISRRDCDSFSIGRSGRRICKNHLPCIGLGKNPLYLYASIGTCHEPVGSLVSRVRAHERNLA
jgi:hypothetical protein